MNDIDLENQGNRHLLGREKEISISIARKIGAKEAQNGVKDKLTNGRVEL